MKNTIKNLLLCAALGTLAACSTDNDNVGPKFGSTREITVNCAGTRTTIDYEGSDVSHLVWQDGDRVAYVTDAAGDTFRTADVVSNCFSATVPSNAGTLTALWPVAGNEGLPMRDASVELKSEIQQTVGAKFDGSLLPMFATVEVPANGASVNAFYRQLGVIVRLTIDMFGHETELLKSVTLSANEDLVGTFSIDPSSSEGWTFSGTSKEVEVVFPGDVQVGGTPFDVYMVVRRGSYTGVAVAVETDVDTYEVKDGAMSLDREGRVLYRIEVPALEKRPAPQPKDLYFTEVADASELTCDGKYLFVAVPDEADKYVAAQFIVESNNGGVEPVTVTRTEKGVLYDDETSPLAWCLKDAGENGFNLQAVHNNYYLMSSKKSMLQPWYVDMWPLGFSYLDDDELAGGSYGVRGCWKIEIAADGEAFIRSVELVDNDNVNWWIVYKPSVGHFRTGTDKYGYKCPMKVLKLRE